MLSEKKKEANTIVRNTILSSKQKVSHQIELLII